VALFCNEKYRKKVYTLGDGGLIGSLGPKYLADFVGTEEIPQLYEIIKDSDNDDGFTGFNPDTDYDRNGVRGEGTKKVNEEDIKKYCSDEFDDSTNKASICIALLNIIQERNQWAYRDSSGKDHAGSYAWWDANFLTARTEFVNALGQVLTGYGIDSAKRSATGLNMVRSPRESPTGIIPGVAPLLDGIDFLNINNEGTGGAYLKVLGLIGDGSWLDLDTAITSYLNAHSGSGIPNEKWLVNIDGGGREYDRWAIEAQSRGMSLGTHGGSNVSTFQFAQHLPHMAYNALERSMVRIDPVRSYPNLHTDITYFGLSKRSDIEYRLFRYYAMSALTLGMNSLNIENHALPGRGVPRSAGVKCFDRCPNFDWESIRDQDPHGFLQWIGVTIGKESATDSPDAFCMLGQSGFLPDPITDASEASATAATIRDEWNRDISAKKTLDGWGGMWSNFENAPIREYSGKLCRAIPRLRHSATLKSYFPETATALSGATESSATIVGMGGTPALKMDATRYGELPGCPIAVGGDVADTDGDGDIDTGSNAWAGPCVKDLGYNSSTREIRFFEGRLAGTYNLASLPQRFEQGCLYFKWDSDWIKNAADRGKQTTLKITFEAQKKPVVDALSTRKFEVGLAFEKGTPIVRDPQALTVEVPDSETQIQTATLNLRTSRFHRSAPAHLRLCNFDNDPIAFLNVRLIARP
jgi:hypothetical protein